MSSNAWFFKNFVYDPVLRLRGEWFYGHLANLQDSQYWSKDKLVQLQQNKLAALLGRASQDVPYYQEVLTGSSSSAITDLPFLDKDTLRVNFDALKSVQKPNKSTLKTSGGSTGAAVQILKSSDAMAHELAASWRGYSWAGVEIGEKQGSYG